MEIIFRAALESESAEIAQLVNLAYRPSQERQGWTHESTLISGDRITDLQVKALFSKKSTILVACCANKVIACVHVEDRHDYAYIGMLSCDPMMQNQGLGKIMLDQAEQYAVLNFNANFFKMRILSSRPELLAFYERRGYQLSGEEIDFHLLGDAGKALVSDLKILGLIKEVQPV